jgi:mono/diheme cytochrome c family protein
MRSPQSSCDFYPCFTGYIGNGSLPGCVKAMNMNMHVSRAAFVFLLSALMPAAAAPALADVNAGAALVQKYGCQGCHGTDFKGTSGFPPLYGIERRRSHDEIVDAIVHPKAPMPDFGLTASQAGDIAGYLASLDGGASHAQPTITITPAHPSDSATVTVHFPGNAPSHVEAVASMSMGGSAMTSPKVELKRSPDGHTYTGSLSFGMGGSWTLHITYDGQEIDQPISIGQ